MTLLKSLSISIDDRYVQVILRYELVEMLHIAICINRNAAYCDSERSVCVSVCVCLCVVVSVWLCVNGSPRHPTITSG